MCAYPAFFSLYPTFERVLKIRSLQYSNGVRPLSLWSAYIAFDSIIVVATSAICTVIFVTQAQARVWYHVEYLFICLVLYGLAATLFCYNISLLARSQLAAFAWCAGLTAVVFLCYLIAFLGVQTYVSSASVDYMIAVSHFTIILYPGDIMAYGGPILYLTLQSIVYFGILLWHDSGKLRWDRLRRTSVADEEDQCGFELQGLADSGPISSSNDGLRVRNLSKEFGNTTAVQDVSFSVPRGQVFALLGPNGAGKTTIISLIRGELKPDHGEIYVENIPVLEHLASARACLGTVPQFDAMDQMTVTEHLVLYARIRGVEDVSYNVQQIIRAVGLQTFGKRMAAKLSGGNKRKLTLVRALCLMSW